MQVSKVSEKQYQQEIQNAIITQEIVLESVVIQIGSNVKHPQIIFVDSSGSDKVIIHD